MRTCEISGCNRKLLAKGLCAGHYERKRSGRDMSKPLRTSRGSHERFRRAVKFVAALTGTDECLEWPYSKSGGGYPKNSMHRTIVAEVYGGAEPHLHAAHSCGNPSCCNPAHLRFATVAENSADRKLHGTYFAGEQTYQSKLTWDDVSYIRSSPLSNAELGRQLGVASTTILSVRRGKTWKEENRPA